MRRIPRIINQQNIFRSIAIALFVLLVSFIFFMAFLFVTAAHARTLNQDYLCSILHNKGQCHVPETILQQGTFAWQGTKTGTIKREILECFRTKNENFRQLLERRRSQFEQMLKELMQKRKSSALWRKSFPKQGLAKMYASEMAFYRKGMRLYRKNGFRYQKEIARYRKKGGRKMRKGRRNKVSNSRQRGRAIYCQDNPVKAARKLALK